MKQFQVEKCKAIIESLQCKSFGYLFRDPVDPEKDDLENYFEIVKKPMCFRTVLNNLQNREYASTKQWFDDMTLIFDNASRYYSSGSDIPHSISMISEYMLQELNTAAFGMNIDNEKEWIKAVQDQTSKMTKLLSQPPIDQNNSKVVEILKRIDTIPEPEMRDLLEYSEILNDLTTKPKHKKDLYKILEHFGYNSTQFENKPVDFEQIKPEARKALIEYAKESS